MGKNRTNSEYKLTHIILGLVIGFFTGCFIIYYGFNRQNVSLLNNYINIPVLNENKEQSVNSVFNPQSTGKTEKNEKNYQRIKSSNQNYHQFNQKILIRDVKPDKKAASAIETTGSDFAEDTAKPFPKDIRIEKEKLLYKKAIKNPETDNSQYRTIYPALYSILGKNIPSKDNNTIILEFWDSPLNSKGYKMGKNKLVLYGISLHNYTSLKYHDTTLYLQYLNQYYPLKFTSEFKSLQPVSDLALIEQLQHL